MRPLRIVARGYNEQFRQLSRTDLRRVYRLLRADGMTAWQARSLITDIALSADFREPTR